MGRIGRSWRKGKIMIKIDEILKEQIKTNVSLTNLFLVFLPTEGII